MDGGTTAPEDRLTSPERRRFLLGLMGAISALAGVGLTASWVTFIVAPLRRVEPVKWRPLGPVEKYAVGETVRVDYLDPLPLEWSGEAARTAVWLRRTGPEEFIAFSAYCTHVGCPVRWVEGARLFLCPCHGGSFHADGSVAAGPPPAPLARHAVRVRDGQVEVQTRGVPRAT